MSTIHGNIGYIARLTKTAAVEVAGFYLIELAEASIKHQKFKSRNEK